MPDSPTETRLRAMVAKHYCVEDVHIHADADFEADLGGDSLDSVEFSMYVKEEFEIQLSDDEVDTMFSNLRFADHG